MEKQQCAILLAMTILIAIATIALVHTFAKATTLSLEAPPPPPVFLNGTFTNLSADDKDRDISINPYDDLPANGTQTMSTHVATDVDINLFPPVGVSVIIQNDTITVTNHTVDISTDLDDEIAQQAIESNNDGSDGGGDEE
jgi:hypothetical protein